MQGTTGSALLKELETQVISEAPSNIGTPVTDGTFFLPLLKELPITFGLLATSISKKVCEASNVYPKDCKGDKRCQNENLENMYEVTELNNNKIFTRKL